MPKLPNQKLKLLYLHDILLRHTDEEHPLTLAQIMSLLTECGVEIRDRKSLYDDVEQLRRFGLDVVGRKEGRDFVYFVASREFELPELKLLVDAVQSSRFITHKKTEELIRKVEGLASIHDARLLQRQVFVANRIKTMNESIYYNVDTVHAAISQGSKISFRYFEWVLSWGAEKVEKKYRRDGRRYVVSPWALTWDDENYYLVGLEEESGQRRHFRVDKMSDIVVTGETRDGAEEFADFDTALYARQVFGMFGGEEETVKLRFPNALIGVVVDRFGKDVFLSRESEEYFSVTAKVAVSPQFLSWVFSFGSQVQIKEPAHVAQRLRDMARAVAEGEAER